VARWFCPSKNGPRLHNSPRHCCRWFMI
jgi:hypothetical protein